VYRNHWLFVTLLFSCPAAAACNTHRIGIGIVGLPPSSTSTYLSTQR
jgi:hypothetical protein